MASWRTAAASLTLGLASLAGAAACGAGPSSPKPSSPGPSATAPTATASSAAATGTVWLCRPGLPADPCAGNLAITVVAARGARRAEPAPARRTPPYDCFYVYGTAGGQQTPNTNLDIQPADIDLAITQAQRFSQVCDVWAPIYRQRTQAALSQGLGGNAQVSNIAYQSLLSAWTDYLRHDNHGRPVIFIGHSQGAAVLIRLLASQVDPDPSLRARVVVAILAGGNVTVPPGKTTGGSFQHLPLCTAAAQTGCVIAYSSFPSEPPGNSTFGRPGQGVSLMSGQTATTGVQVACVNPAALGGGTAGLTPYFPDPDYNFPAMDSGQAPADPGAVPWVTYPDLYSASCRSADGATWLQVDDLAAAGDTRPVVSEVRGPMWGYHPYDINLALGNLITDVTREEAAYTAAHPGS